MYDLSILIPARNEMFLSRTVEDILKNKRGKTEILIGLDGLWADPPIPDHPDVTILYYPESIGQRALTNQLARLSSAKYVMKVDGHCAFDEGFDVKLISEMKDHYTMVPTMYNLHAFDWVCQSCEDRHYQGPTPEKCSKCGGKMDREIIWKPRWNRESTAYRFDTTLHFQYWGDYKKIQKKQGDICDTMSLQGSCFLLTREKYWELNICDEEFGSWGQQGVEVAVKTWLSGGEVKVNKKTWYAHMFRTQGGDFGFPYKISGRQVDHARKYSRDLFLNNKWDKQIHPFSWLFDKFKPVPEWHEEKGKDMLAEVQQKGEEFYANQFEKTPKVPVTVNAATNEILYMSDVPTKEILFYTDNRLNLKIAHKVQNQLKQMGLPIISVSLKPMNFGHNIHLPLQRGYLTMAKQILAGLEKSDADIIFFCEHDVLYHESHFDFIPETKHAYYYNTNVWRVRLSDGHALWTDNLQQLSGMVGYRTTLLEHYRKRVQLLEEKLDYSVDEEDFNKYIREMGFEPGTHGREARVDDLKAISYQSLHPNIDIRHDGNLTPSRWNKDQFRNEKYTEGWMEKHVSELTGWDFGKSIL